jgi:hypothetical protein
VLVLGIVAGQGWLFGPSLLGRTLLAPTDLLQATDWLGQVERPSGAQNWLLADPPLVFYPWMDFAAREVRAGRLPLWNPYEFCGSPFLANNQSGVFSPFVALYYLWPNPRALAWIQLIKALVAGVGCYAFTRRIGCGTAAAVLAGCAFPLIGFLVAWLCFPLSSTAVWLPWLFWATHAIVERPSLQRTMALACLIAVTLLSGHLETAAHMLAAAAFFGMGSWVMETARRWHARSLPVPLAGAGAAALGLALAAVQLWPTFDYLQDSRRLKARREQPATGSAQRAGRAAEWLRLAFPYALGSRQPGSKELGAFVFNEGGVNGYAGFAVLLLLAPLGVVQARREPATWLWVALGLLAAAPGCHIPLLDGWTRLPPFDLMRNNRALLVTAWAVVVLGAKGFDVLDRLEPRGRLVLAGSVAIAALCGLVCLATVWVQPARLLRLVTYAAWPWFRTELLQAAAISACVALLGTIVASGRRFSGAGRALIAALVLGELLASASGYNPQSSVSSYYPRRDFIEYLRQHAGSARVCGMGNVLAPNLAMAYGLRELRGYDAVDPREYLELLELANPAWVPFPPEGVTLLFSSGPSPILDLLGTRYIVTAEPMATSWQLVERLDGLCVYRNDAAMDRVFVPREAVVVSDRVERRRRLGDPHFDPRQTVLVSEPTELPPAPASGTAEIAGETATEVTIRVRAQTDCLVVLADAWAAGWVVRVDGKPARALQADHALRAVRVPAGVHEIVWRYEPAGFRWGLYTSWLAGALVCLWAAASAARFLGTRETVAVA